jgi:hypothetical protein
LAVHVGLFSSCSIHPADFELKAPATDKDIDLAVAAELLDRLNSMVGQQNMRLQELGPAWQAVSAETQRLKSEANQQTIELRELLRSRGMEPADTFQSETQNTDVGLAWQELSAGLQRLKSEANQQIIELRGMLRSMGIEPADAFQEPAQEVGMLAASETPAIDVEALSAELQRLQSKVQLLESKVDQQSILLQELLRSKLC